MADPIKITRPLAALLVRELPRYLGALEKAGIAPPQVDLRYADGLSRADATALHRWALGVPQIRAALRDTTNPDHAEARAYFKLVGHFATEHPQKADGTPADWSEPLSPAMRAYVLGESREVKAADLSAGEAQAFLSYADTRSDLVTARRDTEAANHVTVSDEFEALHARASEPATSTTTTLQGAPAMPIDPAVQGRVAELRSRLFDQNPRTKLYGSERTAALDELNGLLAQMPADAAAQVARNPVLPAPAAGSTATTQDRIAQLNARLLDKDIRTRSMGAERGAVISELNELLAAPPTSAPSGTSAPASTGNTNSSTNRVETLTAALRDTGQRTALRGADRRATAQELSGLLGRTPAADTAPANAPTVFASARSPGAPSGPSAA